MKAKLCLTTIIFFSVSSRANIIELPALNQPQWNFSNDTLNLSGSLVFDQSFDSKKRRPYSSDDKKDATKKQEVTILTTNKPLNPYISQANFATLVSDNNSSELKPKVSDTNFLMSKNKTPLIEETTKTTKKSVAVKKLQTTKKPRPKPHQATLWILDENAHSVGNKKAVPDATVYWVHPQANIVSKSNELGHALSPLNNFNAARFVVIAPGYIPHVGYGIAGNVSSVLMYSEEHAKSVSKGLMLESNETLILGKIVNSDLTPISDAILDLSDPAPARSYYSARAGIFSRKFHPAPTQTSTSGNFALVNLGAWKQYLMPTILPTSEWPAAIINLEGLIDSNSGEKTQAHGLRASELSTLISEGTKYSSSFTISDSMYGVKPETAIHATVGGQRGVYVPEEDGSINIPKLSNRSFVDLLDIKAKGYLDTWISSTQNHLKPLHDVALFTEKQLRSIMRDAPLDLSNNGIILGKVSAKNFQAHNLDVEVYDSYGNKASENLVHYFESELFVEDGNLRFAISNLEPGEWHVALKNTENSDLLSLAVSRVEKNTISQVEF